MHHAGTAVSHRRPAKARLTLAHNIPLEEYRFVSKVASKPAKVSLIGPDRISQRFEYESSTAVYRDMDAFVADVVAIERQIVTSLVEPAAATCISMRRASPPMSTSRPWRRCARAAKIRCGILPVR